MKIRINKNPENKSLEITNKNRDSFNEFPSIEDLSFLEEDDIKEEEISVETIKRKNKKKNKKINKYNKDDNILEKKINEKYLSLKIKKIIVTGFIIIFSLFLLVFGTYNTFFKKEKSIAQLAAEINRANATTPFPTEGIEGFLNMNIYELLIENITFLKGTNTITIDKESINIIKIAKKSSSIANVYFNMKLITNSGEEYHNFFIPIYYDWETRSYHPAGQLTLSINNNMNSTKIVDNDILGFKDFPKASEEDVKLATIYLNNFFILVYNTPNANYSQFLTEDKLLGDKNLTFDRITKLELYTKDNKNGYNCKVEYIVTMSEGLKYITTTYLKIEKIKNPVDPAKPSWLIKAIL